MTSTPVLDPGAFAQIAPIDHRGLAWRDVRRCTYLLHQRFRYEYASPARNLHQRLHVMPPDRFGEQVVVRQLVEATGGDIVDIRHSADRFSNHVVEVDVRRVPNAITFDAWAIIERRAGRGAPRPSAEVAWLSHPMLRRPTGLTRVDRYVVKAAEEVLSLSGGPGSPLLSIADTACHWVHRRIRYVKGVTSVQTAAPEVLKGGQGVCQDQAHLFLAILRRLGIACRYLSGHLLGEGATHAWADVLVADPRRPGVAVAHGFDPCNDRRTDLGYLTVAVGRDYEDVAPTSGWFDGEHPGLLVGSQRVDVLEAG